MPKAIYNLIFELVFQIGPSESMKTFTSQLFTRKTLYIPDFTNGGSKSADILKVKVRIGIWKKRIPYQYKSPFYTLCPTFPGSQLQRSGYVLSEWYSTNLQFNLKFTSDEEIMEDSRVFLSSFY